MVNYYFSFTLLSLPGGNVYYLPNPYLKLTM
jgi:hypothetical protein